MIRCKMTTGSSRQSQHPDLELVASRRLVFEVVEQPRTSHDHVSAVIASQARKYVHYGRVS